MGFHSASCLICSEEGEQTATNWLEEPDYDEDDSAAAAGVNKLKVTYPPKRSETMYNNSDYYLFEYDENPLVTKNFANYTDITEDCCDGNWDFEEKEGYSEVLSNEKICSVWKCGDKWIVNVCTGCYQFFIESTEQDSVPVELLFNVFSKFGFTPYTAYPPIDPENFHAPSLHIKSLYPLEAERMLIYIRGFFASIGLRSQPTPVPIFEDLAVNPLIQQLESGVPVEDPTLINKAGRDAAGNLIFPIDAAIKTGDINLIDSVLKHQPQELPLQYLLLNYYPLLLKYLDQHSIHQVVTKHIFIHPDLWSTMEDFIAYDFYYFFGKSVEFDLFYSQIFKDTYLEVVKDYSLQMIMFDRDLVVLEHFLKLGVSPQQWFCRAYDRNWLEGVLLCKQYGAVVDDKCRRYIKSERYTLGIDL